MKTVIKGHFPIYPVGHLKAKWLRKDKNLVSLKLDLISPKVNKSLTVKIRTIEVFHNVYLSINSFAELNISEGQSRPTRCFTRGY